jgi:hypothetical protein
MDMKSPILNDDLKEEVYVRQPLASSLSARRARCCDCKRHSTARNKHRGRDAKLDSMLKEMGF